MFIASELGCPPLCPLLLDGVDERWWLFFWHREDIAARGPEPTGPGSSSYAAGTDPEQAAESAKLLAGAHKVLGWVPVLGGLLGKAEQSQKRQGPQGV